MDAILERQARTLEEVIERMILAGVPLEWMRENLVLETDDEEGTRVEVIREPERMRLKVHSRVRIRRRKVSDTAA